MSMKETDMRDTSNIIVTSVQESSLR